jgi:dTDP-4-amino-4,6-dideoxygalactose transaminase
MHRELAADMDAAIRRVVARNVFILGPELDAFEREFASWCGTRHCVGVASGTDALLLALRAAGVGPGDEVVTVAHTFIATALGIILAGAKPVFVDIDPVSYTMDPDRVEAAITERTRALMPVHLYGRCADMGALGEIARRKGLLLVEDAAQAHGASRDGRRAGTVGALATFSFYPAKNLGACGDAGAVVSSDEEFRRRLLSLRNYGQAAKYHHPEFGYNSRLDEIQAALLRAKLPHVERWNSDRRRIASRYRAELWGGALERADASAEGHVYHLFVVRVHDRDAVLARLQSEGIEASVHYPVPVHKQEAIRTLPHLAHPLPVTERVADEVLSLPLFPGMEDEQVDRVIGALNRQARPIV